jgi:hypothetical protein
MNDVSASNVPQLKAFQGWLSAIHSMVGEVGHSIDDQIEYHEGEIKRLRARRQRSAAVLKSMELALKTVDENLTRAQHNAAGERPSKSAPRKTSSPRQPSRSAGAAAKRPRARGEEIVIEEVSE